MVFAHFEKLHYLKSSCPELFRSNRPSYYFNYKRKPAERNFLNVRCSLTVQNRFFKLKRFRHGSFLWNFEICFGLSDNLNFGISLVKGISWGRFLVDLNLEFGKIRWKSTTFIFNQVAKVSYWKSCSLLLR